MDSNGFCTPLPPASCSTIAGSNLCDNYRELDLTKECRLNAVCMLKSGYLCVSSVDYACLNSVPGPFCMETPTATDAICRPIDLFGECKQPTNSMCAFPNPNQCINSADLTCVPIVLPECRQQNSRVCQLPSEK